MSTPVIDVHSYDRKLVDEKIIRVDDKKIEEKIIKILEEKIKSIEAVEIMKSILSSKDIDPINNIDIRNLLLAVVVVIEKNLISEEDRKSQESKLYSLLEEQLSETKKYGSCLQGKSIRLFQLYISLNKS